ncbi:hypothetical protein HDU76_006904 [Blyttiomyces sp. JEL0837]|nr:hypothetical protein HDU76_006904 [Blyttiomyces sp. JEL0837]
MQPSTTLLTLPQHILIRILLWVGASPHAIQKLPLVCRQFRNTIHQIPIAIKVYSTIFPSKFGSRHPDHPNLAGFTFRAFNIGDRFAVWLRFGLSEVLVRKHDDDDDDDIMNELKMVWNAGFVQLVVNGMIIPSNTTNFISVLEGAVRRMLLDTNRFTNMNVLFTDIDIFGDADDSQVVRNVCNFVERLKPKKMALMANSKIFSELKHLDIIDLDFYQNPSQPLTNLVPLSKFASSLRVLQLTESPKFPEDFGNFMLPNSIGGLFHSLNGLEDFHNLTIFVSESGVVTDISDLILGWKFNRSSLPTLGMFSIGDNTFSTKALLHLVANGISPAVLEVGIDLHKDLDFFTQCRQLSFWRLREFYQIKLLHVPCRVDQMTKVIEPFLGLMPYLVELGLVVERSSKSTDSRGSEEAESVSIRPLDPPEAFMDLVEKLDKKSGLCRVWISNVADPVDADNFVRLYMQPIKQRCRSLRVKLEFA